MFIWLRCSVGPFFHAYGFLFLFIFHLLWLLLSSFLNDTTLFFSFSTEHGHTRTARKEKQLRSSHLHVNPADVCIIYIHILAYTQYVCVCAAVCGVHLQRGATDGCQIIRHITITETVYDGLSSKMLDAI